MPAGSFCCASPTSFPSSGLGTPLLETPFLRFANVFPGVPNGSTMGSMQTKKRTSKTSAAIWERVIHFEEELSPLAARALLKIRFSPRDHDRMHELSGKARAGTLTDKEELEIDTYERLGCVLDILHSKARRALKKRRTVS